MFALTHQSTMSTESLGPGRGAIVQFFAFLREAHQEWKVRREIACAQMLDGASLRDIGVAPSGLENAIRHGRKVCG
jgi:hypothetical protein